MSDIVVVMLKYLTQRCNVWELHHLDEDLIIISVSALLRRSEDIHADNVKRWLLDNGWEGKAATKFKLIIDLLKQGKKIKINDIMSAPTERAMLKIFDDNLNRDKTDISS